METPDFDSFLAAETTRQHEADVDTEVKMQVRDALFANLKDLGIKTLLDQDEDVQEYLKLEFIQDALPRIRSDVLDRQPDVVEMTNFEYRLDLAAEAAYDQQFYDEKVIFDIVCISYVYIVKAELEGSDVDPPRSKKVLTAELMMVFDLSQSEPLMQWLDAVLPGESLDLSNPEDAKYIAEAMERHLLHEADKKSLELAMHEGHVIVGISELEDEDMSQEDDKKLKAVGDVVSICHNAQHSVKKMGMETARAQRDEKLDEYFRTHDTGLSSDEINELTFRMSSAFTLES